MQRGVPDVETDWTRGEGQYVLALAYPLAAGGAVVARIDGAALREQLQGVSSTQRAVITLLDQQHRVVYRSQTPESAIGMDLSESGVRSALQSQNTAVIAVKSSIDGVERVYGLARVAETGYTVMVGVPSAILYATLWQQLTAYSLIGLLVIFATMTAALLIARSIARPVRLLNLAAAEFGSGNFSARAPAEGRDEISQLGMNFNAMAATTGKKRGALCRAGPTKIGVCFERLTRTAHAPDHNQGTYETVDA